MNAMEFARTSRKFLNVGTSIARHFGASAANLFPRVDEDESLRRACYTTHRTCRAGLETLDFEVEVEGHDPQLMREKTFLLVGNHMSYMDVLVLASVQPAVFVTSVDMGQVPLLGHLARSGGSLFVERRHRERVEQDRTAIASVLSRGHHVLIYPEGTSTNGLEIRPFKKRLMMSAQDAGVDIMPVVTSYRTIDGEPFAPSNCDRIAWHGDMTFAPHLWQLLQLRKVKAHLEFLPPIAITAASTPDEVSMRAYSAISNAYRRTISV